MGLLRRYHQHVVDVEPVEAPAGSDDAPVLSVPDCTIDDVTAWVRGAPADEDPADGWDDRAAEALRVELDKDDDARSSLVKSLTHLVGPQD